jgi:hypothetical protein
VTDFTALRPNELCIVDLDLLNGFAHTPYPADYRTGAAVEPPAAVTPQSPRKQAAA